jgi:hypothetical protein
VVADVDERQQIGLQSQVLNQIIDAVVLRRLARFESPQTTDGR